MEYMLDRDAARAAEAAGFAASSGSGLLHNPEVRAMIDMALVRHREKVEVDAGELVRELARVALADLADVVDDEGNVLPLKSIPLETRRAISEYTEDERYDREGERVGTRRKIRLASKNEAAIALLKFMFEAEEAKKRLLETMSDEELQDKAQKILEQRSEKKA